jgi:hypothetical protein
MVILKHSEAQLNDGKNLRNPVENKTRVRNNDFAGWITLSLIQPVK